MGNLELQDPDWDDPPRLRCYAGSRCRRRRCMALTAIILLTVGVCGLLTSMAPTPMPSLLQLLRVRPCLGRNKDQKADAATTTNDAPLQRVKGGAAAAEMDEFLWRRDMLAKVLHAEDVDAFVAELGPSFAHYANISQADWETLAPSQRPLLIVIQPVPAGDGSAVSRTTLLAPRAEAERVRALVRRSTQAAEVVTWAPHWNPYATLRRSWLFEPVNLRAGGNGDNRPVVVVDPATRTLVVDSLGDAGFRYKRPAGAVSWLLTPEKELNKPMRDLV
ncbi:Peptidase structural domain [Cordyceps militaris]|uniref:Peptidase structural domain n=1 Tax=Cordyceps militaris TaxID=73501 RepID=A0A2H4SM75_CORMI|nr:Peptidase structural domain [Cordyceps militaris]